MDSYDFKAVEQKYNRAWIDSGQWIAPEVPDPARKRYLLTMFPYPSGDIHMGHVEIFTIHDAIARYHRMKGWQVLNPMGWDAFGLPAENAAIKRGINPKEWTYENIDKHRASMEALGYSFDWSRVFYTCEPSFYRWNQWIFLLLYERGLAYRKQAPANWCPVDKTVLANEQVIAGRCERCGSIVEKRYLTQWFFKITEYADRLLDDLELNTGWTERLKMLQANWIGRSYGAEVEFGIEGTDERVTVFTTRPDTLWGATFFVFSPEHSLAEKLVAGTPKEKELQEFKSEIAQLTEIDRTAADRPKKGLALGLNAINPVNDERIPIWVADYVLMEYGTGAIMAVPAHDQRDFEFASQYGLDIRRVITPAGGGTAAEKVNEPWTGEGEMVNSGPFDGTPTSDSVRVVTDWLTANDRGRPAKSFRIRDWLISRQRYWGTPIPIVFCEEHGEVPVPEDDLPVELPDLVDFNPTGEASPLATAEEWVNTTCPKCGKPARRETDTMDTFVDSSWYFHRFLDPANRTAPFRREVSDEWMPIDQYTGGITHAVMHLIYARFIQKVFMDLEMARDPEPFPRLLNQGMVTMGGKAMSKSRGNIVEPQEALALYGADALRLYMLFSGPPEQDFDWPDEGVSSIGRVASPWLQRVWRLCEEVRDLEPTRAEASEDSLRKHIHRTIRIVTEDFDTFSFNTAIARLMELVNEAYRYRTSGGSNGAVLQELCEALLKMLAPFAPYLAEEQWHRFGHDGSIHSEAWPAFDPAFAIEEEVTMVVQVDGKVRDTIAVPSDVTEEEMEKRALSSPKVQAALNGNPPVKVITRPPKLISLVAPKN
jgi:leucyl-tRNA synthetase